MKRPSSTVWIFFNKENEVAFIIIIKKKRMGQGFRSI